MEHFSRGAFPEKRLFIAFLTRNISRISAIFRISEWNFRISEISETKFIIVEYLELEKVRISEFSELASVRISEILLYEARRKDFMATKMKDKIGSPQTTM